MKALLWKEWREHCKWVPLPALLIFSPTALFGPPPILDRSFMFFVSLFAALFGGFLGFVQVYAESQGDKRSLLLHRPLSRTRIFLAKVLAGVGLYMLALGIPFGIELGVAGLPGFVPEPFRWQMVLPFAADGLTGLVYYFAGMLTAQRAARWYGSRCLGFGAGVFCSILVWVVPEFWQAVLTILMVGSVVAAASWGSFLAGGSYAPQPIATRAALAITLVLGLSGLLFVAKSFVGRLWEESGARELYLLDRQGRILDVHQRHEEFRVTLLDGQIPADLQGKRLDFHDLMENAASEARWPDLLVRQSYRSYNRSAIEYKNQTRPGNEIWWYVPDQGWLVGYDKHSKRVIGRFGPDGFAPPGELPKGTFSGPIYHLSNFPWAAAMEYLVFPSAVYQVDFHERTCRLLFEPPAGASVQWASRWVDQKLDLKLAFVGAGRSLYILDETGSSRLSAWLPFDSADYRISAIGKLENPERYWVWFEPQWFLPTDQLETMSAYVVEFDAAGHEIARQTVPARPEDSRRSDPRMLAFEPSCNIAAAGLVTSPAEFALLAGLKQAALTKVREDHGTQMSLGIPVLFYWTQFYLPSVGYLPGTPTRLTLGFTLLMSISAALGGFICYWLARRFALSRRACLGWSLCGCLWGITGLLLMLALYEWPPRILCPKCQKLRVVARDLCEHCGAPHAAPQQDGTEILEPAKACLVAV
jgi:hypothetical protein